MSEKPHPDEGSINEPGVVEGTHLDIGDMRDRGPAVTVRLSNRGLGLVLAAAAIGGGLALSGLSAG